MYECLIHRKKRRRAVTLSDRYQLSMTLVSIQIGDISLDLSEGDNNRRLARDPSVCLHSDHQQGPAAWITFRFCSCYYRSASRGKKKHSENADISASVTFDLEL